MLEFCSISLCAISMRPKQSDGAMIAYLARAFVSGYGYVQALFLARSWVIKAMALAGMRKDLVTDVP